MRSCLRRPLAPGRSRVRAIFVSSVMFFSFSSAIVIYSPTGVFNLDRRDLRRMIFWARTSKCLGNPEDPPGGNPAGFQESLLCSPALRFCNPFCRNVDHRIGLFGLAYTHQNVIHGVLNAGVGLVELASRLGDQLAKQIPVPYRTK